MNLQFTTNNEEIREQVALFVEEWGNENSFFESRTSGSTGVPKTIRIEKRFAEASAKATIDFFQLKPSDNALLCLSIHTIGGKMMLVRSIVNSMTLFVTDPVSNPLKNNDEKLDFIAVAPIQLTAILKESPDRLRKIRTVIVGGGIISAQTEKLLKQEKITVYQTFGMTETISHIALRKAGYEQEDTYTTLKNVTVSGQEGRLCIHAPLIGINELITNDAAEIINDRQFKWIGRTDFVINSGGVKIQVEELEEELQKHIASRIFIHSKKDEVLGEKVILIVEGTEFNNLLVKGFYSFLKNKYYIPKEVSFTSKFLLTASGKINRIATFEQINEHRFKQIL